LEFPAAHRSRIRTTNGLERLVTALAMEQSEEWISGRRYLTMDPFWEERQRPAAPAPVAYAAD